MVTKYLDISSRTTGELLSLTIRESPGSPVIDELTVHFASLRELAGATFPELTEIKGIGPGKATALLASIELAKRLNQPSSEEPKVSSLPAGYRQPGDE